MKRTQYDVVVIGAGSAGLTAAVGCSKIGKSVLLVEREHMGGECTNSGCIPSKALLHAAQVGLSGRDAMAYVRNTVDSILEEETPEIFKEKGIDVVLGEAEFVSKCTLRVDNKTYTYKRTIIATGSQPRMIDIPGLDERHVLTNQNLFQLTDVPEKLLIIGGGPIGLEMAQAFAQLGSNVTIVERNSALAAHEDQAIQPLLQSHMERLGVTVLAGATVEQVAGMVAQVRSEGGGEAAAQTHSIPFDKVLIAIGRTPNLPTGLDTAGISYNKKQITVDRNYRTSNKYVYAIGDVAQAFKFTHTADDAARQVVARIASHGLLSVKHHKSIPKVTYTAPELAQVGLSWEDAVATYGENRLYRIQVPFSQNDRSITDDKTDGVCALIVRRLSGKIIGAHICGPHAGELIGVCGLAIDHNISAWKLQRHIFAYPTYSLIIKKAADQFVGTQLQNLRSDLYQTVKRNLPKAIAAVFWLALVYSFQTYKSSNGLSYQDMLFELLDFFTTSMWGPVLYMVLYAVRPLIFFPATLLTALSGALFGFWGGIIYTMIGENASANFAYWIGRFFGKDLRLEDSLIGNWINALRERSFETVLLMRLFYVPFDLTNYRAGVIKARWSAYFWATAIGTVPGLTTFVALGAAVDIESFKMDGLTFDAFDPKFLALSVCIFVISLGLSKGLQRCKKTN